MLEQNLAALFRGFATELEGHRASLTSIGPEADALIVPLDDLVTFLLEQAQILEKHTAKRIQDRDRAHHAPYPFHWNS